MLYRLLSNNSKLTLTRNEKICWMDEVACYLSSFLTTAALCCVSGWRFWVDVEVKGGEIVFISGLDLYWCPHHSYLSFLPPPLRRKKHSCFARSSVGEIPSRNGALVRFCLASACQSELAAALTPSDYLIWKLNISVQFTMMKIMMKCTCKFFWPLNLYWK